MMMEYDKASRTDEGFDEFLKKYAYVSHQGYLEKIGAGQLEKIKIDKNLGYAQNLKRR